MSPETEREFSYTFIIAAAGLFLYWLLSLVIDFDALGSLCLLGIPLVPVILLLITQIGKKTFFSLKTISLAFMTLIQTWGIICFIMLCLFISGKLH